jgi:hypothetical protein
MIGSVKPIQIYASGVIYGIIEDIHVILSKPESIIANGVFRKGIIVYIVAICFIGIPVIIIDVVNVVGVNAVATENKPRDITCIVEKV